jgi:hypothetical protein
MCLLQYVLCLPAVCCRQAEAHPAQRSPAESYFAITYPFTTNRVLRDQVGDITEAGGERLCVCVGGGNVGSLGVCVWGGGVEGGGDEGGGCYANR